MTESTAPSLSAMPSPEPLVLFGWGGPLMAQVAVVEGEGGPARLLALGSNGAVRFDQDETVATVPAELGSDVAVLAGPGAVALQGLRQCGLSLGETVVVLGLTPLGLMAVALARRMGLSVVAIGADTGTAQALGATVLDPATEKDLAAALRTRTAGRGADALLVAAADADAAQREAVLGGMRPGARVMLAEGAGPLDTAILGDGVAGLWQAAGAMADDAAAGRLVFPQGFVRWTVRRNLEAVLDMLAAGTLEADLLKPETSVRASSLKEADKKLKPATAQSPVLVRLKPDPEPPAPRGGAPAPARAAPAPLHPLFTVGGGDGVGAQTLTGDLQTAGAQLVDTPDQANLLVVVRPLKDATMRVVEALTAGSNVLLSLPFAMSEAEWQSIRAAALRPESGRLMVDVAARFSDGVAAVRSCLATLAEPATLIVTTRIGEARMHHERLRLADITEAVDTLCYLAGAPVAGVDVLRAGDAGLGPTSLTARFANGALGTVHVLPTRAPAPEGLRVEAFCGGRVLALEEGRALEGYGWPKAIPGGARLDLVAGRRAGLTAFIAAMREGRAAPVSLEAIADVSRIVLSLSDPA